ncbi:MAG: hypothetical protein ACLGI3_10830, partial [Actinomycetes bacterium]
MPDRRPVPRPLPSAGDEALWSTAKPFRSCTGGGSMSAQQPPPGGGTAEGAAYADRFAVETP